LPGLTLDIEGTSDGERVGIRFDHGVEQGLKRAIRRASLYQ